MIRKAMMTDLDSIMEILQTIIIEMHKDNNFQWDENYPKSKDFANDIEKGDLFVSVRENSVVGFICINRDQPLEYRILKWSAAENEFVIHRMGVSPYYRNTGIGAELIKFADELSISFGVTCLKTDTNSLNTKAQRLFQKSGYNFVGEIWLPGKEKPFFCYEKSLKYLQKKQPLLNWKELLGCMERRSS
ncbi:MAG: GNAT family N-acetyltransferase [Desulfosporosinus sp.]|nr:GNAT family N-acetyltransferase [Desulfosporosinus sp.]